MEISPRHPASYRDPAGFIFHADGQLRRQVNLVYAPHYDRLMQSGLYETLVKNNDLIAHTQLPADFAGSSDHYKTLLPRQLPFISYPAEWSPGQLKDAALLTLKIMRTSIGSGMILKDATPRNVQFDGSKPIFIDTLSFETYDPDQPWIAYRQFCECMLFPLYLHHYLATGTTPWIEAWPEGIPAGITARLLPARSRLSLGIWLHVILQSRIQHRSAASNHTHTSFSKTKMINLLTNLEDIVTSLHTHAEKPSAWNNYYTSTILSKDYLQEKERLFDEYISNLSVDSALDLGANDGYFSKRIAHKFPDARIVAADSDWQSIDRLYSTLRKQSHTPITPLCIDLVNPSPAAGFRLTERDSFPARSASTLVIALALVHHLVIGKSIPMPALAAFFAELTKTWLIVEFVPLEDEKTRILLSTRAHFHQPYDSAAFETAFQPYFALLRKEPVPGSSRILYLMKKHPAS